jgi:hypothetical protein
MPKKKAISKKEKLPVLPSVRMYRRIAATFLLLTLAMLSVVLYLATVRADIMIETSEETVAAEFFVSAMTEPQANEDVPGALFEETIEESRVFEVKGEGEEVPANAHGIVTIINDSSSDQPLIATTRLLSEEGILFRIVDGVTVPAGGSIQVDAAADVPGREGEIPATKFTVPGLAVSKQAEIYATSDQAMIGGIVIRAVATQEMLDSAQGDLVKQIEVDLDTKWREGLSEALDGVIISQETIEKRSDTEPGTEVGSFTISTIVKNTGVYYDRDRLKRIAEIQLRDHVPEGQVLSKANFDGMIIDLDQANLTTGTARLRIRIEGTSVLKATSDVLERGNLIGLTAGEAEAYLEEQETIKNAVVELSPFWVRRVPRLKDHIYVEIIDVGSSDLQ